MTNAKVTKKALFTSCMALILCFTMLLGTTWAWFTDEVSSTGNIIQSGKLDAELYWSDDNANWNDASTGAIFDYKYWEPGYTQIKYVKIANVGNLAFQFQLNIIPEVLPVKGEDNLADVIDVYMLDATRTWTREDLADVEPVSTLSKLMADRDGAAYGYLLPDEGVGSDDFNADVTAPRGEISYCIVLKMQEDAGNQYQNLSVGGGFKVQLLATQYTWENDSFDHMYDDDAKFAPKANVTVNAPTVVDATWGMGGKVVDGGLYMNALFTFKTTETAEEAAASPYALYNADFVVTADKDIPGMQAALAGYYAAYCEGYNNNRWVALASEDPIPANTDIRLLKDAMGLTMNYKELCNYVPEFNCGVADLSNGELAGTTLTVELRLYETFSGVVDGVQSTNHETGEYITIGTYTYTFGAEAVETADELATILTGDTESINVSLTNDISLPITSLGSQTPGSGEYKLGGENTKEINIDLNGHTLTLTTSYMTAIGAKNADATITIKNGSMNGTGNKTTTWNINDLIFDNCNYVFENVVFDKEVALKNTGKNATMKNVTINGTGDYYALWISARGQNVTIDGLTVDTEGRGIKIDEQYVDAPAKVTLNISNAEFNTAKKAAIMVKSAEGADITLENVDITNVAADATNAVWNDANAADYIDLVTVTGGTKVQEQ